jgi:glycerophosphoryl diester phosphodiesterase
VRAAGDPPLVLAHRGARTVAPENTIEAFRIALEQRADGVELDVHRTADGGVVVHHDATAPALGVLAELELTAIRAQRPDVPTLEEALDACRGALVNVEIKNLPGAPDYDESDRVAALVVELLAARGHRDHVLVSSFNLSTIDRLRELDPAVPTGFLVMLGIDPLDAAGLVADRGHDALHPVRVMLAGDDAPRIVGRAHELGVAVNAWTVNDEAEIERLASIGVDAVITDHPDVARRVIDGRPAPPG